MTRSIQHYAPLITPICGMLGAIVAISPVQFPLSDTAVMLGFAFVGALILGIPAGTLFWAMSRKEPCANSFWLGMMIAYCICIFAVFYLVIYAIRSV